jgi:hypothetical protein
MRREGDQFMSIRRAPRSGALRLALAGMACIVTAGTASALEVRHHPHHKIGGYAAGTIVSPVFGVRTVGAPLATRTTAHVHYVVPVVPTLLGIRPAPVGQPVVYVIDQPEPRAERRRGEAAARGGSGPSIHTIRP